MNSSVQMQWCNFRLPAPFPNKTPVTWFLLQEWFYGVIDSVLSAWEGAARAQPQGHWQLSHVGGQDLIPWLSFLTLLPVFPAFLPKTSPCTNTNVQTDTQLLWYYFASSTMEGAPAQQWCLVIFITHKFGPKPSSTKNDSIHSQPHHLESDRCLNFHHPPNCQVSPLQSHLLLMKFWFLWTKSL